MLIAVYSTSTGLIRKFSNCGFEFVQQQCKDDEEFYLNCPTTATHIKDGEPVTENQVPNPNTTDPSLVSIRKIRDILLSKTDWTQLVDSQVHPDLKTAYVVYRQALRDITKGDLKSIVWPTHPLDSIQTT